MPPLSRWLLRAGLFHLLAALALAVVDAAGRAGLGPAALASLRPVWIHLLVVGWATQMIFGVAHWMFPRASRERPRGREGPLAAAGVALNAGLVLRAVAEPLAAHRGAPLWGGLLLGAGALQWGALVVFAAGIWPRVRGRG